MRFNINNQEHNLLLNYNISYFENFENKKVCKKQNYYLSFYDPDGRELPCNKFTKYWGPLIRLAKQIFKLIIKLKEYYEK